MTSEITLQPRDSLESRPDDDSATRGLGVGFHESAIDFDTQSASRVSTGSGASSGSAGIGFTNVPVVPAENIRNQSPPSQAQPGQPGDEP